jgi:hypothetical protein
MRAVLFSAPERNDDHIALFQIVSDIRPGHLLQDKRLPLFLS